MLSILAWEQSPGGRIIRAGIGENSTMNGKTMIASLIQSSLDKEIKISLPEQKETIEDMPDVVSTPKEAYLMGYNAALESFAGLWDFDIEKDDVKKVWLLEIRNRA
jgi:hypothetical protein